MLDSYAENLSHTCMPVGGIRNESICTVVIHEMNNVRKFLVFAAEDHRRIVWRKISFSSASVRISSVKIDFSPMALSSFLVCLQFGQNSSTKDQNALE